MAPPSVVSAPDARPLVALALLWLAGLYLRLPVLAAPPLALDIATDLDLGQADIGALTTLPLAMVAFGALPAARLMRRVGVRRALLAGLAAMAAMSAARGLADGRLMLFGATIAMGFGIATMQTVLPSAVGAWTPRHLALGTAAYMNGMMVGEFAGAGLTLPLVMPLAGGDWRAALLYWSLPVAAIVLLLAFARTATEAPVETTRTGSDGARTSARDASRGPATPAPGWRDPLPWRLGVPLGGSVVVFYAINAYMGSTLDARGETDALAALLLAFNLSPFAASLALLPIGERWTGRRAPLALGAAASVVGLVGFVLLPGLAGQACAVLAGFAATFELILLVSLPPALVRGAAIGRLTAAMTTIGYGIAVVVPVAGGALADALGAGPAVALVPSLAIAALSVAPLMGGRPLGGS